jgi:hypothetical protein
MTDIEVRKKILQALYEEYKAHGRGGVLRIKDLAERLALDVKLVDFNAQYLIDNGFVRLVGRNSFSIEAQGVNFVEGPSEFNPAEEYIQQSIQISGGEIGQIFQAKEITIKPEVLIEDLTRLVNDYPGLQPEEKKRWLDFLKHPLLIEMIGRILDMIKG